MNKWKPDDLIYPSFMDSQRKKMSFVPFDKGADDIVINEIDVVNLCKHLDDVFGCRYWFIHHDQDIGEDGESTPPHFHIVLQFLNTHRFMQIYREITDFWGIEPFVTGQDKNGKECHLINQRFSIGQFKYLNKALRYLTHIEEPSWKTRYLPFDVFSNDMDRFNLAMANIDPDCIDFKTLEKIIIGANGRRKKIIAALGIATYNRYRQTINDLEEDMVKESANVPFTYKGKQLKS